MNIRILLIVVAIALPTISFSQKRDTLSTASKIDSIFALQKKMYSEIKNEPLKNKKYGVELNLFRLLTMASNSSYSISGSFSLFNIDRKAEIAFPFFYQKSPTEKMFASPNSLTLDCHYRYFLGNTQNGFYMSAFTRYANLNGITGANYSLLTNEATGPRETENKLGLGIGLGYRYFSYKGFYWGSSLSVGRYLFGHNDKFASGFSLSNDDGEYIIDMELLKFGWAF